MTCVCVKEGGFTLPPACLLEAPEGRGEVGKEEKLASRRASGK